MFQELDELMFAKQLPCEKHCHFYGVMKAANEFLLRDRYFPLSQPQQSCSSSRTDFTPTPTLGDAPSPSRGCLLAERLRKKSAVALDTRLQDSKTKD